MSREKPRLLLHPPLRSLDDAHLHRRVYEFADLSSYSFWERWSIRALGVLGYWWIAAFGRTIRWTVVDERYYEEIRRAGKRIIYAFWHNRIFLATWFWRHRGIVVMTSQSFDGEYIARFIQRFGYGAARGSSTRGGNRALLLMAACLHRGLDVAFTIDGPRGPVYVAKPGAVMLAKLTGQAILPFHISAESFWELPSWDRFQIPKPFTRAVVLLGPPITVPADADEALLARKRAQLQATLDALRERGDRWFQA
ncbi:hypothetical protein HRbin08_00367 [bacterium HR08]|nr:hypothetical protein HRbin08_00367 [bacterium HR08]